MLFFLTLSLLLAFLWYKERFSPPQINMKTDKAIRVSITMPEAVKLKYAKLATQKHMSFSQLVRYALEELDKKSRPFSK